LKDSGLRVENKENECSERKSTMSTIAVDNVSFWGRYF